MNSSRLKLPGIGNQRGAVLLVIMMLILSIIGIYSMITLVKRSNERAHIAAQKRKGLGVKCKRALEEIRIAMDGDKKLTGNYPYYLDDEFLDRYKILDRYVFNKEIWSRQADNTVYLETTYGESYVLTGYCRDGFMYSYDSIEDKLFTSRYGLKYNEDEGVHELKED